jgi:uncharacterized protein YceK
MKTIVPIIIVTILLAGCSTIKQAKADFTNFRKTIQLNLDRPAVYQNAYF